MKGGSTEIGRKISRRHGILLAEAAGGEFIIVLEDVVSAIKVVFQLLIGQCLFYGHPLGLA